MVVGAGRGPLVNCCLRAAEKAERKVHLYALEKNPNAFVTYGAKPVYFYTVAEQNTSLDCKTQRLTCGMIV